MMFIMQFYLCIVETQCINAECYEESKSFIMTQQKKKFVEDFCEKPLFLGYATITWCTTNSFWLPLYLCNFVVISWKWFFKQRISCRIRISLSAEKENKFCFIFFLEKPLFEGLGNYCKLLPDCIFIIQFYLFIQTHCLYAEFYE